MRSLSSTSLRLAAVAGLGISLPLLVSAAPATPKPAAGKAAPTSKNTAATPAVSGWNYKFDDDELENTWSWTAKFNSADGAETRIVFGWRDARNYQMLRAVGSGRNTRLRFWTVDNGVISKLGDPDTTLPGSSGELTLQRSAWRVRALWNGHSILTATLDGGKNSETKFGTAVRGKAGLSAARMQPTEAVVFRDDFMRAQGPDDPEVPGLWHRVSGTWKTSGLLGPKADAALNPNPFVYRAEAGSAKIKPEATVGKWFWSDYVVEAAIRPTIADLSSPLIAGVAAYRQANGTSLTGEIDFNRGIASLRLGKKVLAVSKPFNIEPDQWHRVFLDPGPGIMRLVVDGIERARYESPGATSGGAIGDGGDLAQGEASLVSQASGGNFIDFDDVRIAPNDAFSDEFTTASVGRWTDVQGTWQTRPAAGKTPARRVKLQAGPALSLAGVGTHREGRIEASFIAQRDNKGAAFGAVFAAREKNSYFLAKVLPGAVQIVEVTNGAAKVLGASTKGTTSQSVEVEWRDGAITARSGTATATANVNTIADGRAGLWADGPLGSWAATNFRALGIASAFGEGSLPERFTKDRLMQNWASNASLWTESEKDKTAPRWHTGDFFSDATVSLPFPVLADGQKLVIYAGASQDRPEDGSRLTAEKDGNQIVFEIAEANKTVKQVAVPLAEAKGELRFARRPVGDGRIALRAALPTRALFAETAKGRPANAANTKMGIRTDGNLKLDWNNVIAHSSNVLDYSFTGAPTDWRVSKGAWNVSERWTCSPQWGFFGGVQSVNPTLWSRFALGGDWTMEAYLASPMDTTRGERSPMDLNVTIGGDGRDLASGYSFLFAANGRQQNRIYRGDEIAAEKPFLMPQGKGSTHQDWFYVRLERRQTPQGLRFRYSVNGQEVWNYTDTKPLSSALNDANHIAFWTYNGGLSIARVRLWYSGLENGEAATRSVSALTNGNKPKAAQAAEPVLKNALGEWQPRRENMLQATAAVRPVTDQKQQVLEIANTMSGGDWTVSVSKTAFDAKERPTLKFRYRVPKGVLVNLYALVDNKWREIVFTGDSAALPKRLAGVKPQAESGAPPMGWGANLYAGATIGKISDVATDGKWHNAEFDLLGALQKAGLPTEVKGLAFAAPDRDYLRAGLGGNHMGATYWLAGFDAPAVTTKVAAR